MCLRILPALLLLLLLLLLLVSYDSLEHHYGTLKRYITNQHHHHVITNGPDDDDFLRPCTFFYCRPKRQQHDKILRKRKLLSVQRSQVGEAGVDPLTPKSIEAATPKRPPPPPLPPTNTSSTTMLMTSSPISRAESSPTPTVTVTTSKPTSISSNTRRNPNNTTTTIATTSIYHNATTHIVNTTMNDTKSSWNSSGSSSSNNSMTMNETRCKGDYEVVAVVSLAKFTLGVDDAMMMDAQWTVHDLEQVVATYFHKGMMLSNDDIIMVVAKRIVSEEKDDNTTVAITTKSSSTTILIYYEFMGNITIMKEHDDREQLPVAILQSLLWRRQTLALFANSSTTTIRPELYQAIWQAAVPVVSTNADKEDTIIYDVSSTNSNNATHPYMIEVATTSDDNNSNNNASATTSIDDVMMDLKPVQQENEESDNNSNSSSIQNTTNNSSGMLHAVNSDNKSINQATMDVFATYIVMLISVTGCFAWRYRHHQAKDDTKTKETKVGGGSQS